MAIRYKIGTTRRATWKPLEETYTSLSHTPKRALIIGGWNDKGQKVTIEIDERELERIAGMFKPKEGVAS